MFESVSPNLYVDSVTETLEFYKILGFNVVIQLPETDEPYFAMIAREKVTFLIQSLESLGSDLPDVKRTGGGSIMLYLQINGLAELYTQINNRVHIIKKPDTTFYGTTEFTIKDNNGFVLTFAEDNITEQEQT
jgi:uncharacterized glyoxalase superfamily protein PhnB